MSFLQTAIPILLFLWAVGTTIYGLWLSKQNNDVHNKRIIELLETISEQLETKNK